MTYEPMLNISLQDVDEELQDLREERRQLQLKLRLNEECMQELMQARKTLVLAQKR